VEELE
jgi:hypothetical protein